MRTPVNFTGGYTSADLLAHLALADTAPTLCLKVTPTAGAVVGLTTHSADLVLPGHAGVTFRSQPGFEVTQAEFSTQSFSVVELMIPYHANSITEGEWLASRWSHARLDLLVVNYEAVNMGQLLFRYVAGNGKDEGSRVRLEGWGLGAFLQSSILELTSPTCRAVFGDARCTKDLTALTRALQTVTAVTSARVFRASALPTPTRRYDEGKVTFTTGANSGITVEVKSYDDATKQITTKLPFPYAITVGDKFTVVEGCNHSIADCVFYGNAINMQAEPYTPLPEKANRTPPVAG
jgi:uncharacterized phage protein (TIGR02218 family)